MHHVRKFGAKPYIHVKVSAQRQKFDQNAIIGYVLGYREDTVGYEVYVPEPRTTRFVADVRVDKSVMFKYRCTVPPELSYEDWSDANSDICDSDASFDHDFPSDMMDVDTTANAAELGGNWIMNLSKAQRCITQQIFQQIFKRVRLEGDIIGA